MRNRSENSLLPLLSLTPNPLRRLFNVDASVFNQEKSEHCLCRATRHKNRHVSETILSSRHSSCRTAIILREYESKWGSLKTHKASAIQHAILVEQRFSTRDLVITRGTYGNLHQKGWEHVLGKAPQEPMATGLANISGYISCMAPTIYGQISSKRGCSPGMVGLDVSSSPLENIKQKRQLHSRYGQRSLGPLERRLRFQGRVQRNIVSRELYIRVEMQAAAASAL